MQITPQQATRLMQRFGIRFFPPIREAVTIAEPACLIEAQTQHLPTRIMPLGAYSYCQSAVTGIARIGRYCSIGRYLKVITHSHPSDWVSSSPVFYNRQRFRYWTQQELPSEAPGFREVLPPVTIENDVWIGDDVTIKGGCTIGTGAILGAGALVLADVEPYSIVGGVPARPLRSRFDREICEALLTSQWWNYAAADLADLQVNDPEAFLMAFSKRQNSLEPLAEARQPFSSYLEEAMDRDV